MIRTIASLIIRIPPLITQQTGFTLYMGLLYVPFSDGLLKITFKHFLDYAFHPVFWY